MLHFLFLFFVSTNAQTNKNLYEGHPECPCIDATLLLPKKTGLNGKEFVSYVTGDGLETVQYLLPSSYGSSSCQKWDEGVGPDCGQSSLFSLNATITSSLPEYCSQRWCYVDPEACRFSKNDLQATQMFPGRGLFFSYGTCGTININAHLHEHYIVGYTAGKTLTAGIPILDYPEHYKEDPETGEVVGSGHGPLYFNDSVPWKGYLIEFFNEVVEHANFDVKYVAVSNGARAAHPDSAWTAAAQAVAWGEIDFSLAGTYITYERTKLVTFTTPFNVQQFQIWVPRPKVDDSFYYRMTALCQPFHWTLWLLIAVVLALMSLVELWFDRRVWRVKWGNAQGIGEKVHIATYHIFYRFTTSCMQILSGFGEPAVSPAQVLAWIGWAFFILIVVSSYTANLAAFLTNVKVGNYLDSMDKVIDSGKAICVVGVLVDELKYRYPIASDKNLIRGLTSPYLEDIRAKMKQNGCEVLMSPVTNIRYEQDHVEAICAANLVPTDVVYTKPQAFPANKNLAPSLTYWMEKTITFNNYFHFDDFLEEDYLVSKTCPDGHEITDMIVGDDDSSLAQLHPVHFIIPVLAWFTFCAIGILWSVHRDKITVQREKVKKISKFWADLKDKSITPVGMGHETVASPRNAGSPKNVEEGMEELNFLMEFENMSKSISKINAWMRAQTLAIDEEKTKIP